jgi:RNA polymerase sigma-70 factor (ECF subfamily)
MYAQMSTHTSLLARLTDRGDAAAWREFAERYGELIRGFARRRGLQSADCDDVVQEVLLSLSKALPGFRYDASKGKFRSFLKTVALNAIIDRHRRRKGQTGVSDIENTTWLTSQDPEAEQAWEMEWRQYHLRQALRVVAVEFSETDYNAFRHYALEHRDARQTAAVMGLSVDQVYQAKSRITKRLTALIDLQMREEG